MQMQFNALLAASFGLSRSLNSQAANALRKKIWVEFIFKAVGFLVEKSVFLFQESASATEIFVWVE